MKIFDTHCDTISKIYEFGGSFYKNNYHVDIKRMKQYNNFAQIFAMFADKEELSNSISTNEYILKLIKRYHEEIEGNLEHISHCENAGEIEQAFEQNKIAAVLAIEGGEALGGDLDNLYKFHGFGVKVLTLTWNYDNELGSGTYGSDGGLTDFGKEVVREMNRLGMIIDVSHLNEAGFWDVMKITKTPVIASHSNAYEICKHPRNLTDKQISALVDMNGYIGLNLYSDFLNDENADITDVLRHIEYFEKFGAIDILGLGCDFDGVDKLPNGIAGVEDVCKLPIDENIAFNNFFNYIWRVL